MSILERIVETKKDEVASLAGREPELRAGSAGAPPARGFARALSEGEDVAVIAEVKRRSPGAGAIRPELDAGELARRYEAAGARAVSVLTDEAYFGGSLDDLRAVREAVELPILRKDFTVEPVQVWEARDAGADAVLLIVRVLDDGTLVDLLAAAGEAGLDALVEVHDRSELRRAVDAGARLVGVNNRDLTTFETRLETTLELVAAAPEEAVVVSESGIGGGHDVARVGGVGVDAVLVGEWILRHDRVEDAIGELTGHRREARPGG